LVTNTVRCEALSDGVFAIAITLLVLEIRLPHGAEGHLAADLAALWPSYLAFGLSFFSIIVSWLSHLDFMRLVRAVDRPSLLANALFLFYVTCVPFSTSVLAAHLMGPGVSTAVTLYAGVFILGSVASILMLEAIVLGNLFVPGVDAQRIRRYRRALWSGLLLNVGATLLALVLPILALALVFIVRVMWLWLRYELPSAVPAQSGH
jgi:uncharacterized membrane protein